MYVWMDGWMDVRVAHSHFQSIPFHSIPFHFVQATESDLSGMILPDDRFGMVLGGPPPPQQQQQANKRRKNKRSKKGGHPTL